MDGEIRSRAVGFELEGFGRATERIRGGVPYSDPMSDPEHPNESYAPVDPARLAS